MLDLDLLHTERDPLIVKSQLFMITQFLGAVSLATEIISFGGSSVYSNKALDRSPSSKAGVR